MPNMRPEQRVAARGSFRGVGLSKRTEKPMRLALLTGAAAALSLIGAAGAQAEMVYVTEPSVIETAPAYTYADPPLAYSAPVVAAPAPVVVPPRGYLVAAPRDYVVVSRPVRDYVRPQPRYVPRPRVVINRPVAREEIVTTGYSAGNCFIDLAGVERCY